MTRQWSSVTPRTPTLQLHGTYFICLEHSGWEYLAHVLDSPCAHLILMIPKQEENKEKLNQFAPFMYGFISLSDRVME